MLRILHFSDVHVQGPLLKLRVRDWLSKRGVGATNLWLRRARAFARTPDKLRELAAFARQQSVDLAVCTGDFTALGTEAEYRRAAQLVEPFREVPQGLVAVPGNHDLYLNDSVLKGRFGRHFGDLVHTDMPQHAVDGPWPFVRFFGEHLAVVGVNSARPNPNPFKSSGRVPAKQLEALGALLLEPEVQQRTVLLLTHYAPLRRDGRPDRAHHGLRNVESLLDLCAHHPQLALLHGHIHWRYHHPPAATRPWVFGAGSATFEGREGLWMYEVDGDSLRAVPGAYVDGAYRLDPAGAVVAWGHP